MYVEIKCPECHVQRLIGATRPIKEGYLLKYKKRLFGKDWKENWVVLFEDSTMAWYKHRDKLEMPNGTIIVKEAPEMLAVGEYTFRIPGTPQLPPGSNYRNLMAFGSRMKDEVHWLLATSENEVNEWMTTISNTLPFAPTKLSKYKNMDVKNGIITYNDDFNDDIGNVGQSNKSSSKKCRKCCSSCDYESAPSSYRSKCNAKNTTTKCNGNTSPCDRCTDVGFGSGLLMGHAMANVTTGWRGWGEGIGWQIAGLCSTNYGLVENVTYHLPGTHDLAVVDYENGVHSATAASATASHEAAAIIDSTSESAAGIWASFDFLI